MKANELMIGDFVKCGDILILISRINKNSASGVDIDALEPIPITDEILEKNGFTRVGGRSTHESHNFLILHWSKDNLIFNSVAKDGHPIHIPHLQYVHELQHAMRINGFGKYADNFKL